MRRSDDQRARPARSPAMHHDPVDERLTTHLLTILSVSAGMVGVCLTAIGLLGIVKSINRLESLCDDLLAFVSLLFLLAATLSFVGLRTPLRKRAATIALVVDWVFCSALALTSVACALLVWVVL